ncbi:unnamed protein product [Clonostachys rhizophaga]|uniref:Major facilitator superfamily (MFS) profile domain-containing protein n=1 Tax=Clonostachys rhizophaga TaxID=160324 RepID=A0A9N9VGF9_9HYPO|nr:unnamed protein product [Clonostachys rhizophaga]
MHAPNVEPDLVLEHGSESDLDVLAQEKSVHHPVPVAGPRERNPDDEPTVHLLGLDALLPTFCPVEILKENGINDALVSERVSKTAELGSPFLWSTSKKVTVLCGAFMASCLAAYAAGAYALAAVPVRELWRISDVQFNAGITTFVMGFGIAPMILAPVSEAHGRYWVFVGSGVTFLIGTIGCAVTNHYAGMLVSRFIVGCGASVYATLTGGVVSDLYHKEDRNTPMALYSLSIMAGTGLGPLVSGAVVDHLGWRWVFYIQACTVGFTTLIIFVFFQETRSNVVLRKKCRAMNNAISENTSATWLQFQSEMEERKFNISIVWRSFAFPLQLLATESIVFWFSAWASFAWAILYMQFSSIGIVFRDVYGFNSTQVGAVYVAVVVGSTIACLLAIFQEPITHKFWPSRMTSPEGRLLPPGILSALLPIGLFWFGWTATPSVHWISPTLAIGSCTIGIFSIYLAGFNYLADSYHLYASSALAAQSMCRNLLAGIFPLFTMFMLKGLRYWGAGSLLGGIGLCLTAIPWLLAFYGQRIRARSPFAGALVGDV